MTGSNYEIIQWLVMAFAVPYSQERILGIIKDGHGRSLPRVVGRIVEPWSDIAIW